VDYNSRGGKGKRKDAVKWERERSGKALRKTNGPDLEVLKKKGGGYLRGQSKTKKTKGKGKGREKKRRE